MLFPKKADPAVAVVHNCNGQRDTPAISALTRLFRPQHMRWIIPPARGRGLAEYKSSSSTEKTRFTKRYNSKKDQLPLSKNCDGQDRLCDCQEVRKGCVHAIRHVREHHVLPVRRCPVHRLGAGERLQQPRRILFPASFSLQQPRQQRQLGQREEPSFLNRSQSLTLRPNDRAIFDRAQLNNRVGCLYLSSSVCRRIATVQFFRLSLGGTSRA